MWRMLKSLLSLRRFTAHKDCWNPSLQTVSEKNLINFWIWESFEKHDCKFNWNTYGVYMYTKVSASGWTRAYVAIKELQFCDSL